MTYEIHYWGFSFAMGDEILHPAMFGSAAERDASLAASCWGDDPHLSTGSTTDRCETCGTYITRMGSRLGVGCGDCR